MTFRNLISVLAASLILLTGCSDNKLATESSKSLSHKGDKNTASSYQKPGARVSFSHSFKGPIAPGEDHSIQLIFKVPESAGQLEVQLRADAGLSTDLDTDQHSFGLDSKQAKTIDLSVKAEQPGKYYLTIFANLTDGQGQTQSRVFAVAIEVGDASTWAAKESMSITETASGESIIILPAQETVSK